MRAGCGDVGRVLAGQGDVTHHFFPRWKMLRCKPVCTVERSRSQRRQGRRQPEPAGRVQAEAKQPKRAAQAGRRRTGQRAKEPERAATGFN